MKIKNNRRFALKSSFQLFYRVKYSTGAKTQECIDFSVGCTLQPEGWDQSKQRPKKGFRHAYGGVGRTAAYISALQDKIENAVTDAFKEYEVKGEIPTRAQLRDTVNANLGRSAKPSGFVDAGNVCNQINEFIKHGISIRAWKPNTIKKYVTLHNAFEEKFPTMHVERLTINHIKEFQVFLMESRKYRNSTLNSMFKWLREFLRWCRDENDYSIDDKVIAYKPSLSVVENDVVFLSFEEFKKIYALTFGKDQQYLERARDVFCFQCATGLRYSDVQALKPHHINNGKISITMQKTSRVVVIALNKYSSEILEKYDNVLPVNSNQKQNKYIKEVCRMAEINDTCTRVYNIGAVRHEKVFEKWQLIATHTARRTFVSVSLSLGATQEQVMSITGHSTVMMMEKYVGLTNDDKLRATNLWNEQEKDEKKELLARIAEMSVEDLKGLLDKKTPD